MYLKKTGLFPTLIRGVLILFSVKGDNSNPVNSGEIRISIRGTTPNAVPQCSEDQISKICSNMIDRVKNYNHPTTDKIKDKISEDIKIRANFNSMPCEVDNKDLLKDQDCMVFLNKKGNIDRISTSQGSKSPREWCGTFFQDFSGKKSIIHCDKNKKEEETVKVEVEVEVESTGEIKPGWLT